MGYSPRGYKRVGLHLTTKKQQASEGEGGSTPLKKIPAWPKITSLLNLTDLGPGNKDV